MPTALETSEAPPPNANTPTTPGEVHVGGLNVTVSDAVDDAVGDASNNTVSNAASSASASAPGSAPGGHLAKRLRVLLVDDEPGLAKTLKFLLDDDYDTEAYTSGSAALERILEGGPFDIVLCDLMMPNVSGIDLYHRVAETRPGQEARIFFMTGGAFTPRGLAFLEQVPNPRLEKPFSPDDFDRAIEHWRQTIGTHL